MWQQATGEFVGFRCSVNVAAKGALPPLKSVSLNYIYDLRLQIVLLITNKMLPARF
jgi:hypothetical protein